MKARTTMLLTLTLLFSAALATAQTPLASVRGIIRDPSAAAIPGVAITLVKAIRRRPVPRPMSTGAVRDDGNTAGHVSTLTIEQPGYKKQTHRLRLRVNQEVRNDATLEIGNSSDSVEVIAPRRSVERLRTSMATVIESQQITVLPLDGRNFLELSLLAPGRARPPRDRRARCAAISRCT